VPGPAWIPSWHISVVGRNTSIRYTERLAEVGIAASVGTTGDSYDNALAETINGPYKTELIKRRGPWRTVDHVQYGTAEYINWFNHRRLYEYCGDIPPVELEMAYYAQQRAHATAAFSHQWLSGLTGAVQTEYAVRWSVDGGPVRRDQLFNGGT
jgi:hypothetical protein